VRGRESFQDENEEPVHWTREEAVVQKRKSRAKSSMRKEKEKDFLRHSEIRQPYQQTCIKENLGVISNNIKQEGPVTSLGKDGGGSFGAGNGTL